MLPLESILIIIRLGVAMFGFILFGALCALHVQSLGWEDALEKRMATYSSILVWRVPLTEEPADYSQWGQKELDTTE